MCIYTFRLHSHRSGPVAILTSLFQMSTTFRSLQITTALKIALKSHQKSLSWRGGGYQGALWISIVQGFTHVKIFSFALVAMKTMGIHVEMEWHIHYKLRRTNQEHGWCMDVEVQEQATCKGFDFGILLILITMGNIHGMSSQWKSFD